MRGIKNKDGSKTVTFNKYPCTDKITQILYTTRQVLGRPVCDRGAIPRTLVQSNVVRSRLIILINEEINEANLMVSNSAELDRRTKQHTQFGVSAINGSRDMAWTKSWQKKGDDNNNSMNYDVNSNINKNNKDYYAYLAYS